MNILIIGSGMYVSGRGTDGYGIVLPSIFEWNKKKTVESIHLMVTSEKSKNYAHAKIEKLKILYNCNIKTNITIIKNRKEDLLELKKQYNNLCSIIAVPDHLHFEVTIDVIQAGIDVLVVKPLVSSIKEANILISEQLKQGVYCAVEMHKRLDKSNLVIKNIYKKGELGNPLYFLVEYSQKKSIPENLFRSWVENTNIFQYLGIHYLDMIYYITGATPIRAIGIGQNGFLKNKGINAYDSIQAVIEWKTSENKFFSSMFCTNWIDPVKTSAMSDQKIKLIGTKGRIEADQKYRGITLVTDEKGIEDINPYYSREYNINDEYIHSGYGIDSINQFLSDVSNLRSDEVDFEYLESNRPTFKNALIPISIIEAVNESLITNNWINI